MKLYTDESIQKLKMEQQPKISFLGFFSKPYLSYKSMTVEMLYLERLRY